MSAKLNFYFKNPPFQRKSINVVINNMHTLSIKGNTEAEFEVSPGKCRIQMSMPHLGTEVGTTAIDLDVNEGDNLLLTYKIPLTIVNSGTILVQKK